MLAYLHASDSPLRELMLSAEGMRGGAYPARAARMFWAAAAVTGCAPLLQLLNEHLQCARVLLWPGPCTLNHQRQPHARVLERPLRGQGHADPHCGGSFTLWGFFRHGCAEQDEKMASHQLSEEGLLSAG